MYTIIIVKLYKIYRKLIEQVLDKVTKVKEWHDNDVLQKIGNISWNESINFLHEKQNHDLNSSYYRRLAYDEILSNMLLLSEVRKRIKKLKKIRKKFNNNHANKIIENSDMNNIYAISQVDIYSHTFITLKESNIINISDLKYKKI